MTPAMATAQALERTRIRIQRKTKEAAVTHEVQVFAKVTVRVRVQAQNEADAHEQALGQVADMLGQFCEISDHYVRASRAIPAEPAVRAMKTVIVGIPIGDGCYNDTAIDVPADWTPEQIRESLG